MIAIRNLKMRFLKAFGVLIVFSIISCPIFLSTAYSSPPERIVSLAPSTTEILYALGLEERIVAVTTFCDYPPQAKKKPKIGGMSNPSLEAVISIRPDIVVMSTDGNPKEFEIRLQQFGIKTYIFKARRLAELPQDIREIGITLGIKEKAYSLAEEIETAINRLKSNNQTSLLKTSKPSTPKKVLFVVWPEPLIVAGQGTAIDDAIHLLGWENIASDAETKYPKYSVEEVIYRSPDVILIGKGHFKMKELSTGLLKRLSVLEAVKKGRVYYLSDALYRLGPRIVKGIEELSLYLNKYEQ